MGGHGSVPGKYIIFVSTHKSCFHLTRFVFEEYLGYLNVQLLQCEAECVSLNDVEYNCTIKFNSVVCVHNI